MRTGIKIFLLALLLLSFPFVFSSVSAFVNEGWDWHLVNGQPKRELHYCAGNAVRYTEKGRSVDVQAVQQGLPPSWAGWLTEAVDALNNANTGWKLVPSKLSFPPCQILIALADINESIHGGGVATPVDTNGDGKADLVRITIDETLEDTLENVPEDQDTQDGSRDGWSTIQGENTRDPIGTLMHELTHPMRLDHHPDSKQTDASDSDISDPRQPGDHDTNLSEEDLKELRESAGTQEKVGMFEVEPEGQHIEYAGAEFDFQASTFEFTPALFDVNVYDGVVIPDPLALPDDYAYVMGSGTVYIRTNQPLQKPVKVSIPYTDEELEGGPGMYVGDLHGYIPPALDESTMQAFRYVMRPFGVETEEISHWEMVEGGTVDTENNKVTFETTETGIFGIAAKEKQAELEAETKEGQANVPLFTTLAIIVFVVGVGFLLKKAKKGEKKQKAKD